MRLIHAILAAAMAAMLALALGAMAEEEVVIKKEIKILTDSDAEAVVLDVEDLEVGESRQVLTDSGKEVVITRTEEGYDLTVDGKEIEIGGEGHHMMVHGHGGEDGEQKVIVKHFEVDDSKGYHFITADGEDVEVDLEEAFEWVHEGGHYSGAGHLLALGSAGKRAAEHLEKSGVLDDLDDAKRQEILDVLEELDDHAFHGVDSKVIVMKIGDEDDEDNDE